jgi:exodeoxyribonuclease VII small subunit
MKESLESALKKLEQITEILEKNEIPLEEAMLKYEEGLKLVAYCNKIISKSEEKIELLSGSLNADMEKINNSQMD